ncbi:MAG: hypothetical protein A2378_04415 [Candidatus Pacebacteria bacterium RIFOXYB1_FULL_44_10]|nr:MAG: hypothetical protein A2378_04415 [Candidatus Pacebacteria bacterium RIFOXYB1_FULL_44_10]HAX01121.1 hypothetical protein [Candidatus Paceibacterota bacterium]
MGLEAVLGCVILKLKAHVGFAFSHCTTPRGVCIIEDVKEKQRVLSGFLAVFVVFLFVFLAFLPRAEVRAAATTFDGCTDHVDSGYSVESVNPAGSGLDQCSSKLFQCDNPRENLNTSSCLTIEGCSVVLSAYIPIPNSPPSRIEKHICYPSLENSSLSSYEGYLGQACTDIDNDGKKDDCIDPDQKCVEYNFQKICQYPAIFSSTFNPCKQISNADDRAVCCQCVTGDPLNTTCAGNTFEKGIWTAIGCIPSSPEGIIVSIVRLSLSIGGGVVLLTILAAAFQLTTSQGEPKKVDEAKNNITAAISGLLFIIFSMVILRTIGVDILKLPGF